MSLLYVQGKSFINVDERNGAKVSQHPELNVFSQKKILLKYGIQTFPPFLQKHFIPGGNPQKSWFFSETLNVESIKSG
ncbi:hypothetical protein FA037_04155 [Bacillus amyloliquefaciens]|nr:hypothetical protein FA037_04155 [Bacillus amyloliquefaciens]